MNNLSSYCGLVDAKIRASDKNLPVHNNRHSNTLVLSLLYKLGSVAGPVIQANGRLEFEDGLRTGVLLHCVSR